MFLFKAILTMKVKKLEETLKADDINNTSNSHIHYLIESNDDDYLTDEDYENTKCKNKTTRTRNQV